MYIHIYIYTKTIYPYKGRARTGPWALGRLLGPALVRIYCFCVYIYVYIYIPIIEKCPYRLTASVNYKHP